MDDATPGAGAAHPDPFDLVPYLRGRDHPFHREAMRRDLEVVWARQCHPRLLGRLPGLRAGLAGVVELLSVARVGGGDQSERGEGRE